LSDAIDYVGGLLRIESQEDSALLIETAALHLAAGVLHALPSTAVFEPTSQDRLDSTPLLLRRAIAFIDENAHTAISVSDIASHIRVSPRAVYLMFRRHHDCTPMEYVEQVRMHRAHLDLVVGTSTTTTVSDIARRWGFDHLGRFVVQYRQAYRRSPHQTLRQ
jgi:transcriptional regulator GlxA family with amidase domain